MIALLLFIFWQIPHFFESSVKHICLRRVTFIKMTLYIINQHNEIVQLFLTKSPMRMHH